MLAKTALLLLPLWSTLTSQCGDTMTQQKKVPNHVYTVELRFLGEPSEISDRLNLKPSNSFSKKQNQKMKRPRRPYWGYSGRGEAGYLRKWESLGDGLKFLLEILRSRKSEIIAIGHQFDGHWWCGHFQSSFNGGPTLSPQLLAEVGSYEMPLCIDDYHVSEE
ncbi:DUF4279 domain-containing protein [Verminephrobacter aporrectodeae subsp. tuberculatae]|uniref:DUF4279 domain-containing protein n=2 Tax=Verminephrobacter TaxID=364316 RepID=A0ABT3KNH7_9BURK|nr:DUF4279 domain-containing protein [Verminephrobacter aporrectodeae subsp. tuberculatae]